ncbi:MAG: anhydro-N-acetylmuramic acid kinase [Flavicella sp.]
MEKKYRCIGLMSGTSLDGVDVVCVDFQIGSSISYKIVASKTYTYSQVWKNKLKEAFTSSADDLKILDKAYGKYLGSLVLEFNKTFSIDRLDFIASHGHTIYHNPSQGFTLQIGCGKELSKKSGFDVVCDFRKQDVAMGGQGAPLVPIGDLLLFSSYTFCLNLGGFANVSFDSGGNRIAFDICPVNIVMNQIVSSLGWDFDDKGQLAASGKIVAPLLKELNALSFYSWPAPKSLGYEFVVNEIFPILQQFDIPMADLLRTFVEHVAQQIAEVLSKKEPSNVLITGGGVRNEFLIQRIKVLSTCKVVVPSEDLVDYKEALVFALLGVLKLEGKNNCLASVTGAEKDHSSGNFFARV